MRLRLGKEFKNLKTFGGHISPASESTVQVEINLNFT